MIKTPQRFWSKVNKTDTCWLWTGARSTSGYGRFVWEKWRWQAHRFSWVAVNGPIPSGLFALHKCDVRACIRPDHLFLGTQKDNMMDCSSKKRQSLQTHPERTQGENHNMAKLNENQVRRIRKLREEGVTLLTLSIQFGVCNQQIGKIVNRRAWPHVD